MRVQSLLVVGMLVIPAAAPASPHQSEINYPEGSLAYEAIAAADYSRAELQLRREVRVPKDDPARLINYGHVLAKKGRIAEAAKAFRKAMEADEIELILADGRVMSSREAAQLALQSVAMGGPVSPDN